MDYIFELFVFLFQLQLQHYTYRYSYIEKKDFCCEVEIIHILLSSLI